VPNGYGAPGGNVVPLNREQNPSIQPFEPIPVASWEGRTPDPLDWLVPGLLLKGEVTLFAGATKLGKTFLCQSLMTAAALGQPWLGVAAKQFRSLGFFAEDREQVLMHRQNSINRHHGISHADLETEMWLLSRDQIGSSARLVEFDTRYSAIPRMTPRWYQLVNFCKDTGIRVVPIDTSARTFGGDESSRAQVTAFVEQLAWLAQQIDGAVILNTHPNKSGSFYSGSTAFESTVRITATLQRPRTYNPETGIDEDVRIFTGVGSNYGSRFATVKLRWDDGVFVAEEMPERKRALSRIEMNDLDYRMLQGLRRLNANGTAPPADPLLPKSLPWRAKRSTPEFREYPLVWLADSVERLIADGRVVRVELRGNIVIRHAEIKIPGEQPWEAV
jgi:RecA-family ATPase